MSLKAGRVGVAPDQVDEFGKIKSEATSGYTKQEADAKFETKTDASAALAEKQPITLSIPIEMLDGTKLTVESALEGLNNVSSDVVTVPEGFTAVTAVKRQGHTVCLQLSYAAMTESAETVIGTVPEGYRPTTELYGISRITGGNVIPVKIQTSGAIKLGANLSNAGISMTATWII